MKKVTKDVAAPLVVSAWKACSVLPLASAEQLAGCVGFYHIGNPRPPMVPADLLSGNAGSGSAAQNSVLLQLAGFRVGYLALVAHLNGFTSELGKLCGNNVDNHTKDLTTLKVDTVNGVDFITCSVGGSKENKWVAVNPEWLAARTGKPADSAVATVSEEPAPTTAEASTVASAVKPASKPRTSKPKSRKAVEASASPADLASGKAVKSSK